MNLFDEWITLNKVISPDRSRFDVVREEFSRIGITRKEAEDVLAKEEYILRYPLLPKDLK